MSELLLSIKNLIMDIENEINLDSINPDASDITCVISNITGRTPLKDLDGITNFRPSIRVYLRDTDYTNIYNRMYQIIDVFDQVRSNEVNNIKNMSLESDILKLDKDKDRYQIFTNWSLIMKK